MTDPRTLEQLAELGRPRGADAVWESGQQRLRRRRRIQQVPLVALVVLLAVVGWSTVHNFGPSQVEVTSDPPAASRPVPCPDDEGTTMQQRRLAALAAAGALMAGCTNGGQAGNAAPDGGDRSSVGQQEEFSVTVDVTGDVTESTTMSLPYSSVADILGDDETTLRTAWAAGEVAPSDLAFQEGDDRLKLSWDADDVDLADPSVIVSVDQFLFMPDREDCEADSTPRDGFVLSGTVNCSGVSGLRPGHDERPVVDLSIKFDFDYRGCIRTGETLAHGQDECIYVSEDA